MDFVSKTARKRLHPILTVKRYVEYDLHWDMKGSFDPFETQDFYGRQRCNYLQGWATYMQKYVPFCILEGCKQNSSLHFINVFTNKLCINRLCERSFLFSSVGAVYIIRSLFFLFVIYFYTKLIHVDSFDHV